MSKREFIVCLVVTSCIVLTCQTIAHMKTGLQPRERLPQLNEVNSSGGLDTSILASRIKQPVSRSLSRKISLTEGTYVIVDWVTGKCLSINTGDELEVTYFSGESNQHWKLMVETGYIKLMVDRAGSVTKCLQSSNQRVSGKLAELADCNTGDEHQQWNLLPAKGRDQYTISAVDNKKCLKLDTDGKIVQVNEANAGKWVFVPIANLPSETSPDGQFVFINAGSKLCMEVENGSLGANPRIQQNLWLGKDYQKWHLIPVDSTHLMISAVHSGYYLSAPGQKGITQRGSKTISSVSRPEKLSRPEDEKALWILKEDPSDSKQYSIRNEFDGKYLFVINNDITTKIEARTDNRKLTMRWEIKSATSEAGSDADFDDYVYGLTYDPDSLLNVQTGGEKILNKLEERNDSGNSVIICKREEISLEKNMDKVSVLSPSHAVVFPGALVKANQDLADGKPTPLVLPRAPVVLSIDLPGIGAEGTRVVANPSQSTVQTAIHEMLDYWNKNPASDGYVNAAKTTKLTQKMYTQEQLALKLDFSVEWASGEVSGALDSKYERERSLTVCLFRQVFYTVAMDNPEKPSSVVSGDVDMDQVMRVIDNNNPPAYVRSVDYGRIIMVKMETNYVEKEVNLEAALNYAATSLNVDTSLESTYKSIFENSTFTVLTVGGNAKVATEVMDWDKDEGIGGKLQSVIKDNAIYGIDNPGLPIAYTIAFLKDNQLAKMGFSTDYVREDCVKYDNGWVKFHWKGPYNARFWVNWKYEENGVTKSGSWASGSKPQGTKKTVHLPGDAKNVEIVGKTVAGGTCGGREVINEIFPRPPNICIRSKGSLCFPKHDEGDC